MDRAMMGAGRQSHGEARADGGQTIANLLFPLKNVESRRQLEQFRLDYEAAYGPSDLTKRYTSTWPINQQSWLIKNEIQRYFDGLPGFAKAWIKGKCAASAEVGKLDDIPDEYLRLFIADQMVLDQPKRGYRGW